MPDVRGVVPLSNQSVKQRDLLQHLRMTHRLWLYVHLLVQRNNVEQMEQNTVDPMITGECSENVCMLPKQHWGEFGDSELPLCQRPF